MQAWTMVQADVCFLDVVRAVLAQIQEQEVYNGALMEGCDWLKEGAINNIDFVCIHPYMDQWRPGKTDEWLQ